MGKTHHSLPGMSDPWPVAHMGLRIAENGAQQIVVNLEHCDFFLIISSAVQISSMKIAGEHAMCLRQRVVLRLTDTHGSGEGLRSPTDWSPEEENLAVGRKTDRRREWTRAQCLPYV